MDPDATRLAGITAVILAAGVGARMQSDLPKVLHPVAGRPMLLHVLDAVREAGLARAVIVTGHQQERVRDAVRDATHEAIHDPGSDGLQIDFVEQAELRGTGHALLQARAAVQASVATHVLVLNGDLALVSAEQIRAVAAAPAARVVLATADVDDPSGFGRIRRDGSGAVINIIEQADTDDRTHAIHEINMGLYRFDCGWLWEALETMPPSAGGEIYLTDAVARAGGIVAVPVHTGGVTLTVENRADLARADSSVRDRIRASWLAAGVSMIDPASIYIDAGVCIGPGTLLEPGTHLRGRTVLGRDCVVGPNAILRDTHCGDACTLRGCDIERARLGDCVSVGPFSTIREGSVLDDGVHIGTHAEVKNAHLHPGVMMGHFSYVGDAEVGEGTNIGAGAITCNFDGAAKHRTVIGARAFIGSDSLLIAPLTVGEGATTGAGSVVNKDVPPGGRVVGNPARGVGRQEDRGADRDTDPGNRGQGGNA